MSDTPTPRIRHYPPLTGLRFVAASAVLLYHFGAGYLHRNGAPHPIVTLLENGFLGVSLFFILSGFILTHTYREAAINGRFFGVYALARFARIYPVYLLSLIIALPLPLNPVLTAKKAVLVLLMIQSWTLPKSILGFSWVWQAWTLSIEAFFYLCFPLLLVLFRNMHTRLLVTLAAGLAAAMVAFHLPIVMSGVSPATEWMAMTPLPVLRLAEFSYGAILCELSRARFWITVRGSLSEILLATAIVCVMALATTDGLRALTSVLIGLLIVLLAGGSGVVSKILSARPMILLGGASYAIYLIQSQIRTLCRMIVPAPFDQFVSPAATIAMGLLIYVLWEQPSRKFLLRLYKPAKKAIVYP